MIISIFWFLFAVASLFVLAACIKGTKSAVWLLMIGGVIFILMGNIVINSGIEVKDGYEETEVKENENRTTIIRDTTYSTYLVDGQRNDWIGMLMFISGVALVLLGAAAKFI